MKGVVFNILEEMVVEQGGMALWQEVLDRSGAGGSYTSVETYTDEELFKLVGAACEALNKPVAEVVSAFGTYMFTKLAERYPMFLEPGDLFSFLDSIDSVIHMEVQKLYDEAHLPTIHCEHLGEHELQMNYRSPRKLCILAEGLVYGAAAHYGQPISISHPVCMHQGSDHCEIRVHLQDE